MRAVRCPQQERPTRKLKDLALGGLARKALPVVQMAASELKDSATVQRALGHGTRDFAMLFLCLAEGTPKAKAAG